MRTPRFPVVNWTDASADLNGLVRFAERRNLVSARVPSHFKRGLLMLKNMNWQTAEGLNTLRTGDADLRFYITTVQDGWRKSAFLRRACFPCTIHLIMQYIEPVSEWSWWRMFIETWPHSELTFRHRASSILGQAFRYSPENAFYIFNQQIYFIIWYLLDRASLI